MALWLTALVLFALWSAATVIRQTVVPFPPWALEVGVVAFVLQFLLYAIGALLEVGSRCLCTFAGMSRLLHILSLSVFLLGGIALYCLVGSILGLASMWALYLLCRALRRYRGLDSVPSQKYLLIRRPMHFPSADGLLRGLRVTTPSQVG